MLARLLFFFRNRPQVLPLLPSTLKTLTASTSTTATDAAPNDAVSTNPKDDYFAAIHHVSNIVRRDFYLERTLNKLRLHVTSEFVFRVLRACSSSPTECHRFFNWARTQTNYRPTTVEFEELIQSLARSRKYETMWKLLHQMKSLSLSPSPDTMSFLIEQYGKHGLVDNAVEIFNKSEKSLNCPQTLELYNALLFSLCESKLFNGAYALIRRMVRKGLVPNKRTYAILVNAWCSAGKMREAQQFLAEMSRKGFNPPVRGRDLLIEGLLNAGYLECAKGIVTKMAKQGFVPDVATFNLLIESICKSGEVEFCLNLYNKVRGSGLSPDINTYKILIPAVSKAGRVDEAFRLLNDAVEYGHKPFPSLYAPVMKAMCRKGQFDDAFCFFSDMKAKGHPPNRPVYTMLITMCGRGGRFVEAANYLVEMTELGLAPISRCFDMVTDGLKNCGKHDLAQRIEQLEKSQYALAEAEMIDYDSSMKCGIMESAVSDHQEQIGGSGHTIEFWYQRAWYYCFSIFKGCRQNALQSLLIESLYFCSNCFVEVDLLRWEYGYVCQLLDFIDTWLAQ